MNQEMIRQIIEEKNIEWIQTHFTDLFGRLRVLHIPSERFLNDDILNYNHFLIINLITLFYILLHYPLEEGKNNYH